MTVVSEDHAGDRAELQTVLVEDDASGDVRPELAGSVRSVEQGDLLVWPPAPTSVAGLAARCRSPPSAQ